MGSQRYAYPDRRRGNQVIRASAAVAIVNFFAFVLTAFYLGGDAVNGYARAGHYFLGAHSKGPFTEVSGSIFTYSLWHTFSVIGSLLFFLIVGIWQRFRPAQP
jgi:hypothetical protein